MTSEKEPPQSADPPGNLALSRYRSEPLETTHLPPGLPYIIGNEAAERFSYYGMRTVLVIFMTQFLRDRRGFVNPWSSSEATSFYHQFVALTYFCPILGAFISDTWLGKYRTIMALSLVYCLGHLALAVDSTWIGLVLGLSLIAIGAGGIKPCVSAHVGDQFGTLNQNRMGQVYGWFYLAINLGAFASTLLTPYLLQTAPAWLAKHLSASLVRQLGPLPQLGPHLAFGVPGILMLLATVVFWAGRKRFVHVPPRGMQSVLRSFTRDGGWALLRLVPVFFCTGIFWSLADQTGSTWITQAEHLNRHWLGVEWLSSQIQAINPLLILILIPLFDYGIYPAIEYFYFWPLTPVRKIALGLVLAMLSFAIVALVHQQLEELGALAPPDELSVMRVSRVHPQAPSIGWQCLAYVLITAAEVMVWVPCLEYSYREAPQTLKSFMMSIGLLSISLGNTWTAAVIEAQEHSSSPWIRMHLGGARFFWFFTLIAGMTAIFAWFLSRGDRSSADEASRQNGESQVPH